MARTKITIDKLESEIDKILTEYADDVKGNLDTIKKKVATKGATALKNESREKFGGSGKYAKGWRSQIVQHPHYTSAVIYNRDLPGLPHLLEHGHAKKNGGRVEGRIHIAKVEEEIIKLYEQEVISKL